MTKKYRHLLFDLDGTLTDPMEGITRSVQYALRHFGIEVSDLRELCPFIRTAVRGVLPDILRLRRPPDQRSRSRITGVFHRKRHLRKPALRRDGRAARHARKRPDIRSAWPRRSPGYSPSGSSTTSASPVISPSSAARDWTARRRRRPM